MHILRKITETMLNHVRIETSCSSYRNDDYPKEFIGAVIGPGGKIIQGMQEETGATITIEEVDGVGKHRNLRNKQEMY